MSILDRISFYVFLAVIFILPLFFLPATALSLGVAKGFIFSIGILISFAIWLTARLVQGKIVIPKSALLLSGFGIVLSFFLSAIFSPNKGLSLFGLGFEIGSWSNILILFLSMFLASVFFSNSEKIKKNYLAAYVALASSYFLIAASSLTVLFSGTQSSIAKLVPFNLVGSLSDLSIYSGFILIMTLFVLELLDLSKIVKILASFSAISALFFMAILNFPPAWITVGIFALIIFIYKLSRGSHSEIEGRAGFPTASFLVVVFCLIFMLAYSLFGNTVSNYFGINNADVRLSVSATASVAKETLKLSPIFGAGPGRFLNAWLLYKPSAINLSNFWDASFNFGYGLIPSFLITSGILGGLAWLVFILLFVFRAGFQAIRALSKDQNDNFMILSSFLGALYLWILSIIYVPALPIFALAFAVTGIFVGVLANEKKNGCYEISFLKDPRISFFSILVLVVLIGSSITLSYVFVKKFAGAVYFQKSALAPNNSEGADQAEKNLLKAVSFDKNDLYFRSLSEVYLIKLGDLLSRQDLSPDVVKKDLQAMLNNAESAANMAIGEDNANYSNWLALARVYESILPLKIEGAYERANSALTKSLEFNPKNPAIYLRLARLEIANKNEAGAENYINKSLELKSNYVDAFVLLAELKAAQGKKDEAVNLLETALSFDPTNKFIEQGIESLKNSSISVAEDMAKAEAGDKNADSLKTDGKKGN